MLQKKILPFIKKKQTADFVIYGIGQFFNLATPLLVVPRIVQVCGEELYGKVGVCLAVTFFLMVIVDYGSDIIGVREVAINRDNNEKLREIFVTAMSAKFFLLLGVVLLVSIGYTTIPYFEQEKALFLLSIPILVGQYFNPIWFLQGIENFKWISLLNIASKVIYIAGIYAFINQADDYIYINLWWGIGMIIPYLAGFIKCVLSYNISFRAVQAASIVRFIKSDMKFCFSQLFLSLKNYAPIMLLSILGGDLIAGQYKVIEQIIMPFRTYLQVFFRFFYPKLCAKIYGNRASGLIYWRNVNLINLVIVVCLLSILFVYSFSILEYFRIDPAYLQSLNDILRYSLLIPLFITVAFTLEQLILILGKKEIYIRITILMVILNFILIFILFGWFGFNGLITAMLITELLIFLTYGIIIKIILKK